MIWKERARSARGYPVSRRRLTTLLLAGLLLGSPLAAGADWLNDDCRINLRSGAGIEYRIKKILQAGDEVRMLSSEDGWEQVRTADGIDGWVPAGNTTKLRPAGLRLPEAEAKLAKAAAEIEGLKAQISSQTVEVEELAELRRRVEELTTSNVELAGSSRWRMLATGGGIVLVGMLIGVLVPRGSGSQRTRRIKL
jgi:SH3 domain protein